jgi:hypothetical protein
VAKVTASRSTGRRVLTGISVDLVTLTAGGSFDVFNWVGASKLTVTFAVDGPTPADPVAGAAETFDVPAGSGRSFATSSSPVKIKVLGNGNEYSVEATS